MNEPIQTPLGPILSEERHRIEFWDCEGGLCFVELRSSSCYLRIGLEAPGKQALAFDPQTIRKLIPVLEQWCLTRSFTDPEKKDAT